MAVLAYTVMDYIQAMERLAPSRLAAGWDNVGLQVGTANQPVQSVVVCLTVTGALVTAVASRADLIIAHHPLIFRPLMSLRADRPDTSPIVRLAVDGTAVYVSHTNLDHAEFGLNYWLGQRLGLTDSQVLEPLPDCPTAGLGRIGSCQPMTLASLVQKVEKRLEVPVRCLGEADRLCRRVAVCGGSGGRVIERAHALQADVLVTGDIDYHEALFAESLGLALIDAGHFGTERHMAYEVAAYLAEQMPEVTLETSEIGADPWQLRG